MIYRIVFLASALALFVPQQPFPEKGLSRVSQKGDMKKLGGVYIESDAAGW